MKLFFIVDEFPFFLPEYLDNTVSILAKKHTIVGITPLVTPHGQKTLYSYLQDNMLRLGILAVVKMAKELCILKLGEYLYMLHLTKDPYTIRQVASKHNIKTIYTKNVNGKEYQELLRKLEPDIVISSCSQIFKKELLKLPRISCINRHSAILPAYGGLFPVFQAMIHNEKLVGATVHKMVAEIDKGEILAQTETKIKKNDSLFSLYKKTYEISVGVTVEAIEKLKRKKYKKIKPTTKESYFSFPTRSDWEMFFNQHKKVI